MRNNVQPDARATVVTAPTRGVRRFRQVVTLVLVASLAGGCGLFRDSSVNRDKGPKLAREIARLPQLDLGPAVVSTSDATIGQVLVSSEAEILQAYRAVYGKVGDPQLNQALGKRLAYLELRNAEELDAEGIAAKPYADAVAIYEALLEAAAESDDEEARDQLLYQLAQSHDMAGEGKRSQNYLNQLITQYPDSPYVLEAHFRRGEMRFSQGDFAGAVADYSQVTEAGDATKYALHASYMLGWSHFKESSLDAAAEQFYDVVELTAQPALMSAATGAGAVAPEDVRLRSQQAVQKELLDDALRVLMLTLNYDDGAESLAEDMRERNKPQWQYLVYERLAADYIEQERFLDGVAAWQTFVDENPLDRRAPAATVSVVEILKDGDFPSEIASQKAQFVELYGSRSEYWLAHTPQSRADYLPTLHEYLTDLSQLNHAQAQKSGASEDYLQAAAYYEQTIETFPEDPKTGDTLFLLGEVYTDARLAEKALDAYQRLIANHPEHPQAAEAGYSSLLALDQLAKGSAEADKPRWSSALLDAQIDFAKNFSADARAPAVQLAAANQLFDNGNWKDSAALSEHLLSSRQDLDPSLRDTARLIVGHSSMEQERYVDAERAYLRYLGEAPTAAPEVAQVREGLLASVYKQGEAAEKNKDLGAALNHYLRIAQLAPGAEIAALAHFDAIAMVEATGDSARVAQLLGSFRDLYPNDPRVADVPARLASMFEEQKDYSAAAGEYLNVAASSGDTEQSRQAHYLAAELYLKDGDKASALREFARYAATYQKPADVLMEALDIQDTLLEEQGSSRLALWQQKVAAHTGAGRGATERMNYLAAEARLQLADIDRQQFDSLALTQPLKRSLKAKQKSLKTTINAYKDVINYGVGDFVTAANFQIADMYVALSRSIMESDRPGGLSALELEQYEILLEEQAFPFEEQAIELHEVNLHRMWKGLNDSWTDRSLAALRVLMPGRFDKTELQVAYVDAIH